MPQSHFQPYSCAASGQPEARRQGMSTDLGQNIKFQARELDGKAKSVVKLSEKSSQGALGWVLSVGPRKGGSVDTDSWLQLSMEQTKYAVGITRRLYFCPWQKHQDLVRCSVSLKGRGCSLASDEKGTKDAVRVWWENGHAGLWSKETDIPQVAKRSKTRRGGRRGKGEEKEKS